MALVFIQRAKNLNFVVFSDSLSGLQSLSSSQIDNSLVLDNLLSYTELTLRGKSIVLCWIPSKGTKKKNKHGHRIGDSVRSQPPVIWSVGWTQTRRPTMPGPALTVRKAAGAQNVLQGSVLFKRCNYTQIFCKWKRFNVFAYNFCDASTDLIVVIHDG